MSYASHRYSPFWIHRARMLATDFVSTPKIFRITKALECVQILPLLGSGRRDVWYCIAEHYQLLRIFDARLIQGLRLCQTDYWKINTRRPLNIDRLLVPEREDRQRWTRYEMIDYFSWAGKGPDHPRNCE